MKLSFYSTSRRLTLDPEARNFFIRLHPESAQDKGTRLRLLQSTTNPRKLAAVYDQDSSIYTAGTDLHWLLGRPRDDIFHADLEAWNEILTFEVPETFSLASHRGGPLHTLRKAKGLTVRLTPEDLAAPAPVVEIEDPDDEDDDFDEEW